MEEEEEYIVETPNSQNLTQIGKFRLNQHLGTSKFFTVFRATVLDEESRVSLPIPSTELKTVVVPSEDSPSSLLLLHDLSTDSKESESQRRNDDGLRAGDKVIIKFIDPNKRSVRTSDLLVNELSLCKTLSHGSDHFISPVEVMRDTVSNQLIALIWRDPDSISLKGFLLQNGPLSPPVFLHVALQIASGLHHMHCEGIVHKDIKSANVIINPQTLHVCIIDLNSASHFREISSSSSSLSTAIRATPMGGTVEYMSPEQTGKVDHPIDCRSDIYSMGMTFFELLVGFTPFRHLRSRSAIIYGHVAVNVPPINKLPSVFSVLQTPPLICAILHKMMQKNPEDRYQSAFGVWKDLKQTHQFLTSSGSIPPLIERLSFSSRVSEDVFVSDLQTIGQNRQQQQQRKAKDQILPFELGRFDHSPFLKQQSQLYCREAEMDQIESDFSLVLSSKKSRLMSAYGFSGISKTLLITEAVRQIKKGSLSSRVGWLVWSGR